MRIFDGPTARCQHVARRPCLVDRGTFNLRPADFDEQSRHALEGAGVPATRRSPVDNRVMEVVTYSSA